MSVRQVVLFGGGGHARSVADVLGRSGRRVVAIVGAGAPPHAAVRVFDNDDDGVRCALDGGHDALVAVGDGEVRRRLVEMLRRAGVPTPPVLATTATVAPDAHIGDATVVCEHAHVGPASQIDVGCIVNTASVVEHDVVLGSFAHIAPGAIVLGEARCGDGVFVGAGATVLPGISIGSGALVGAGAVVTSDVPPGIAVVGVPARAVDS